MAWRDSRNNRARLLFFMSSIVVGTAVLVAIQSLSANLRSSVNSQSKELLGADLVLEASQPVIQKPFIDSLPGKFIQEASFNSMVTFIKPGTPRLSQIRCVELGYPFYGSIEVDTTNGGHNIWMGKYAWVEDVLLTQLNANIGDSIKIGAIKLAIGGRIKQVAGESSASALNGPRVLIHYKYLDQTRLVKFGSRVNHKKLYKLSEKFDVENWTKAHKNILDEQQIRATTVKSRQNSLGRVFGNLFGFFNMVGFISLILGGVGVASAVQVYIRQRIPDIAMLRCLGAPLWATSSIYLFQIIGIGIVGSIGGVVLGLLAQSAWPFLIQNFLPIPIQFQINDTAIVYGLVVGMASTLLFSFLPLLQIRFISPLEVLRVRTTGWKKIARDPLRWLVGIVIIVAIILFAAYQFGSFKQALFYTLGLILACALLLLVASILIFITRKYFPANAPYVLRQGIANLFRPNNQTLTLVLALGLGAFLLFTLFLLQDNLLKQADFSSNTSGKANMLMFDVQSDQLPGITNLLHKNDMPLIEEAPVVTVRLMSVRNKTFAQLRADSNLKIPFWAGEYRVSYRDSLLSSEKLIAGKFTPNVSGSDSIFISVAEDMKSMYNLQLKDPVTFNVQGLPITTFVGSFRKISYTQARPSYLWLFPKGVLEKAPQFHLMYTRVNNNLTSAQFQRELITKFPNVVVLDFVQILKTIQDLLDQIALVIRFLAMFSLLTGLLVLVSALINGRMQRLRENTLLRTLGAQRRQLFVILSIEYCTLGILSATTGLLLAIAATWAISKYAFEISFNPSIGPLILGIFGLVALTFVLGITGNYKVVNSPPLQVLREETF